MFDNKLSSLLSDIYGTNTAGDLRPRVLALCEEYRALLSPRAGALNLDEKAVFLISYANMVREKGVMPLRTLHDFLLRHLRGTVNSVHLLPFFPYSSDDGFSVMDYRQVDLAFGDWPDIESFSKDFNLAFDAVLNHLSSQSSFFKACLAGEEPYKDYFLSVDDDFDISRVVRPRSLPLMTEFKLANSEKKRFWTTFSADQIDLDFRNPELLLEILEVLLFYLKKGATVIRLDAVAFLWKRSGTTCLHLKETHLLVKLMRLIVDELAPGCMLLSETNVPHHENISYFGDGDEAHMVYQFPLPPLTAHAIISGDCTYLKRWCRQLKAAPAGCCFYNFLASHDGIGVRPLESLVPEAGLELLVRRTRENGGVVSSKRNEDGSQSPYELNINYLSLLAESGGIVNVRSCRKFIMAHALMLFMPGVPAIYFHSMFGSQNDLEALERTLQPRSINRCKLDMKQLEHELADVKGVRRYIFERLKQLISIRVGHREFAPANALTVLDLPDERLLGLQRVAGDGSRLWGIYNFSAENIDFNAEAFSPGQKPVDLISGRSLCGSGILTLRQGDFLWLKSL